MPRLRHVCPEPRIFHYLCHVTKKKEDMVINGIEVDGQTLVHDWYRLAYPHDEWAIDNLNKGITFQNVYECLEVGYDIYALLGAGDSIVRERVFDALATLMDVSYEIVYYQWRDKGRVSANRLYTDMSELRFSARD